MATAAPSTSTLPVILIVNPNPLMARRVATAVNEEDYQVEMANTSGDLFERLRQYPAPELVFLNVGVSTAAGLQTLQEVRGLYPEVKVIMMGAGGDARAAVQAVRMGALDYLGEPVLESDLEAILQEHLPEASVGRLCLAEEQELPPATVEVGRDREQRVVDDDQPELVELSDGASFVCASPAMKEIYAQAKVIAKFDMPVLMLGQSGTGKEVVSLLIHHLSPRAKKPFLKVNCAAVPADLLESELFGYEAGAFTGATKAKPGKFELCEGGTILLDEVGEMPPALQAKLLHFLQDHRFSRLGGRTIIQADVRILAATNINVEEALASKALREDLYYRLGGFTMNIPPLRERKKEIPVLMTHFMKRSAIQFDSPERQFSQTLLQACLSYSWPGNLRQLENFVRRYLVLGNEELALAELRGTQRSNGDIRQPMLTTPDSTGLKSLARSVKKEAEAAAIGHALEQTNWHRQKAAALLKISYKALLYKIKQYELHPPEEAEVVYA